MTRKVYLAKSAEFQRELEGVEQQIGKAWDHDPERGEMALAVFDFNQNLSRLWRGSDFAIRREILERVSLNRTLSDVSLSLEKRNPFDYLVERPSLQVSRGGC